MPDELKLLRAALAFYADAINCRRGVFGRLMRNGNRNKWIVDNGATARAALASAERNPNKGE